MYLRDNIDTINKSLLFTHYEKEQLQNLFDHIDYRISHYEKNSLVFIEDERCTTFNIILSGSIQIQKIDPFGKTLTIAEFNKGDSLGENLLFGESNVYPMTGQAKSRTTILQIPKETILELCQRDSFFLTQLLRLLCDKTVTLSHKLKSVTLKNIRQKICGQILEEYKKQNSYVITLNITKKEWADKLGIQRPSLSRELINMKEEGLIDYNRKEIFIKNLSEIQRNVVDMETYF